MPRHNLNNDIPYQIFDLDNKNNQTVFHFVLKNLPNGKNLI